MTEQDVVFEVRVAEARGSGQADDENVYTYHEYEAARRSFDLEGNRVCGQQVTLYERESGSIGPGKMLRRIIVFEGRWEDR